MYRNKTCAPSLHPSLPPSLSPCFRTWSNSSMTRLSWVWAARLARRPRGVDPFMSVSKGEAPGGREGGREGGEVGQIQALGL